MVEIRPLREDVLKEWMKVVKREGVEVSKKLIYGDELYEEVF